MRSSWALQDAKNRLSEVVERALHDGPQTITRRGKDTAVLLDFIYNARDALRARGSQR